MAVTEEQSFRLGSEVLTDALAVAPLTLASAFLPSDLQVKLTKSPAWISFRLETALPCTGRVVLAPAVEAALPLGIDEALSAFFTVMVLEVASTATTSALTVASFFLVSALSSALA